MKIIVGLGNYGDKYKNTRHNVGFDFIDLLSEKYNIKTDNKKFKALSGIGYINGQKVLLLKPLTYMNLSGESVIEALNFFKIDISDLYIVFDDISLNPGQIRIRKKGSAGGHNGIKSIISKIGNTDFPRIKIGVGDKPEYMDLADHVLGHFSKEDRSLIDSALNNSINAIELMINDDIEKAMNLFNKKI